jgi:hypothetical protein
MVREAIPKKKGGEIVAEVSTWPEQLGDAFEKISDLREDVERLQTKVDRAKIIKANYERHLKIKLFFGLIEIER